VNPLARVVQWRRIGEAPWTDECAIARAFRGWALVGRIEAVLEGRSAHIAYRVRVDSTWRTRRAAVAMNAGGVRSHVGARRTPAGLWVVDGVPRPDLATCVDVDLELTPATNTLPIRRLSLRVGSTADVTAAWLRFPSLRVEPLRQRYTRLGPDLYRYESLDSGFTADLTVDADGVVEEYPGLWSRS
jgi:hypothetical protein